MRSAANRTDRGSWNIGYIGVLTLSVCLIFASGLAAQNDRDGAPGRDRDAYSGVPDGLTLPIGTTIVGQVSQYLSSHDNHSGDSFTITLDQPIVVNGWVVARRGQVAQGQVTVARKGGVGKGPSELGIELTELILVDGQQVPITTQLIESRGGSNAGRNVGTVVATTGLGAVIGGIAGGGTGAGVGAGAGAAAGMVGVLLSSGKPAVIPPESLLTFRLGAPAAFSTQGSERAFLPVGPQDYGRGATTARYTAPPPPRPYVRPYPAYPYPYPYFAGPRVTIIRPYRAPVRVYRGRGRW